VHAFAEQTRQFADWVARTSALVPAAGSAEESTPQSPSLADAPVATPR
jgi:hypothetical protein